MKGMENVFWRCIVTKLADHNVTLKNYSMYTKWSQMFHYCGLYFLHSIQYIKYKQINNLWMFCNLHCLHYILFHWYSTNCGQNLYKVCTCHTAITFQRIITLHVHQKTYILIKPSPFWSYNLCNFIILQKMAEMKYTERKNKRPSHALPEKSDYTTFSQKKSYNALPLFWPPLTTKSFLYSPVAMQYSLWYRYLVQIQIFVHADHVCFKTASVYFQKKNLYISSGYIYFCFGKSWGIHPEKVNS